MSRKHKDLFRDRCCLLHQFRGAHREHRPSISFQVAETLQSVIYLIHDVKVWCHNNVVDSSGLTARHKYRAYFSSYHEPNARFDILWSKKAGAIYFLKLSPQFSKPLRMSEVSRSKQAQAFKLCICRNLSDVHVQARGLTESRVDVKICYNPQQRQHPCLGSHGGFFEDMPLGAQDRSAASHLQKVWISAKGRFGDRAKMF